MLTGSSTRRMPSIARRFFLETSEEPLSTTRISVPAGLRRVTTSISTARYSQEFQLTVTTWRRRVADCRPGDGRGFAAQGSTASIRPPARPAGAGVPPGGLGAGMHPVANSMVSAILGPELSVVIATHNRRETLVRCIGALEGQTEDPANFELVVADDGSTDGTIERLAGVRTRFALQALDLGKVGRVEARNAAIRASRGAITLVLDDDVVADPGLIAAHIAAHREQGRIVGVGRLTQVPPARRDWYGRAFAEAWNRHFDRLEGREVDWTACYSGNLSAPRSSLLEVGGFGEGIVGEDAELGYRLVGSGCVVRYLPAARALHDDQKGRRRLLADSRRQGSGQVKLAKQRPEMTPGLMGWFGATSRREVALRRALIALRVPPGALARLGGLLPGAGRRLIWFYFVSRYAFWLAVRKSVDRERWQQLTRGVPVLMYHSFSERNVSDRYVVPRREFARQLRLLRLLRYRSFDFDELARTLRESRLPPRRGLVITIDDGYADNLEIARPLLEKHGFTATVFLITEKLGGVNDWSRDDKLRGRPMLSWDQVERLQADGILVGAHTRTHPHLPELEDDAVEGEVAGSRRDLESRLGTPITTFAYPYGELDERAVDAVRRSGFDGACTVEPRLVGLGDDPLLIPRIEVRSTDSLATLAVNLWLGAS